MRSKPDDIVWGLSVRGAPVTEAVLCKDGSVKLGQVAVAVAGDGVWLVSDPQDCSDKPDACDEKKLLCNFGNL